MRLSRTIVCSALLALALAPATALAQGGTTTSAGDQQYVDPLTGTTTSGATSSPSPAPAASASSGSASGDSPSSAAPTAASTPSDAPSSPTATSGGSGSTLPFTGLNLSACVAVGIGLLGAGLVLRRVARRA